MSGYVVMHTWSGTRHWFGPKNERGYRTAQCSGVIHTSDREQRRPIKKACVRCFPVAEPQPAVDPDLVERVAEAIHAVEFPAYSATAVADHNRWSWRGDGTSEVVREVFREYARAALKAVGGSVSESRTVHVVPASDHVDHSTTKSE